MASLNKNKTLKALLTYPTPLERPGQVVPCPDGQDGDWGSGVPPERVERREDPPHRPVPTAHEDVQVRHLSVEFQAATTSGTRRFKVLSRELIM